MENHDSHIVPYRTYLGILFLLLVLTVISVLIAKVEMGALTVTIALSLAMIKSTLVLLYFMHLKFDKPLFSFMVLFVLAVFVAMIVVTFFDYLFR